MSVHVRPLFLDMCASLFVAQRLSGQPDDEVTSVADELLNKAAMAWGQITEEDRQTLVQLYVDQVSEVGPSLPVLPSWRYTFVIRSAFLLPVETTVRLSSPVPRLGQLPLATDRTLGVSLELEVTGPDLEEVKPWLGHRVSSSFAVPAIVPDVSKATPAELKDARVGRRGARVMRKVRQRRSRFSAPDTTGSLHLGSEEDLAWLLAFAAPKVRSTLTSPRDSHVWDFAEIHAAVVGQPVQALVVDGALVRHDPATEDQQSILQDLLDRSYEAFDSYAEDSVYDPGPLLPLPLPLPDLQMANEDVLDWIDCVLQPLTKKRERWASPMLLSSLTVSLQSMMRPGPNGLLRQAPYTIRP